MVLANNCAAHRMMGDLRRAAAECEEAYHLARGLPNTVGIGLVGLGPVAAQQGNYPAARDYLEESIRQCEGAKEITQLVNSLLNISPVYRHLGEPDKALAALARALELTARTGDSASGAMARFNRAVIYSDQKRYDEALAEMNDGLKLQAKTDSPFELLYGLTTIAQLEIWLEHIEDACAHADRAIDLSHKFPSPALAAGALSARGMCEMKRDNLPKARAALEESIRLIESFRDLAGGGEQDGQIILADRIEPFRNLLSVLLEQGDNSAAMNLAERMRARQLLDTVRRGKTQATASMTAEERQEEKRLNDRVARLTRRTSDASGSAKAAIRKEWEQARNDFDSFRGHLYGTHPQLAASRGEAAPIQLAEMADLLPDNKTVLVEFAVLRLSFCAFVIERGPSGKPAMTMHRVKWGRDEITRAISAFRAQLAAHDLGYRKAASELYARLLGPAAAELRGKDTLVLVPDGPLWNLPFQALIGPDGTHLVERKTIFYAPSLTFLRESRLRNAQSTHRELLAVGNPGTANLPNAAREVSSLARLYGAGGSLALTGGEATKDAWVRDAPEYRVLHIATHG
ncbi:MAG: CHAT domain-containing protein, partial [Acidobacteria bacterium]|nr:CHAT domain-containing protein [Acidobacteriota bacterium]